MLPSSNPCSLAPSLLLAASLFAGPLLTGQRPDLPVTSFEAPDWAGWTASGDAFGAVPSRTPDGFTGQAGAQVAWSGTGGPQPTGRLTSPNFKIERRYLSFRVMGERHLPSLVGVELLADGTVVRATAATEQVSYHFADQIPATKTMHWRTWDVAALQGRTVVLRLNDLSAGGALGVDEIIQSDTPRSHPTDASRLFDETYRPQFHYTAKAGWVNDPHGLMFYRGTWHLFHQYIPPDNTTLVWGHASSPDLLRWSHHDPAVADDLGHDFASGSGMVDHWNASGLKQGAHDPLLLFYTRRPPGPKLVVPPIPATLGRMTQEMAYSTDGGASWQFYAGNPLLKTPDYRDRDPKVIYHEPSKSWFLIVSLSRNNAARDKATYGVFKSPNLKDWKMIQELGPGAWYWECPDLFELPVDGDPANTRWMLVKSSGDYLLGQFDADGFHSEVGPIRTKFGGNYYATQTFQDAPGGRRVQVGWMNSGDKKDAVNVYPGMPFNQQLSFPREITLRSTPEGPRLFREPIREIEQLYVRSTELATGPLTAGMNPLAGLSGELLDLALDVTVGEAKKIVFTLRGEEVVYDVAKQSLHAFKSTAPLPLIDGRLHLRLLLDRTSIEVFGQHGKSDISGVFFPDPANRALSLRAEGGTATITRFIAHELKSAWPAAGASLK